MTIDTYNVAFIVCKNHVLLCRIQTSITSLSISKVNFPQKKIDDKLTAHVLQDVWNVLFPKLTRPSSRIAVLHRKHRSAKTL